MKVNYCLPIIKNTKQEVLSELKTSGYDYYEIWLDYIEDFDEDFLMNITNKFKGKLILLFRRLDLEKIKFTIQERQRIISMLLRLVVYLDIDFLTQHEDLEFLKKQNGNIKLILSFHNYKETPRLNCLVDLVSKMRNYNPDIYKFSTFCQNEEATLTLLSLLLKLKESKLKYIILGMGEKGVITRIVGPIWGSEISFAPKNLRESSARGQLNKKQLELILQEVNYGR